MIKGFKTRMIDPRPTDGRVLALDLLDDEAKNRFNSHLCAFRKMMPAHLHPKAHLSYFKFDGGLESRITKIDLCNVYLWCRCSRIVERIDNYFEKHSIDPNGDFKAAVIGTPFTNAFLTAEPLMNADKCKVIIQNGSSTVQIGVILNKGFTGTVVVGISLHTPNICVECGNPASDTCKLKACSRCFKIDRVRVLYCSSKCQKLDFSRHSKTCNSDWTSDDWRDDVEETV